MKLLVAEDQSMLRVKNRYRMARIWLPCPLSQRKNRQSRRHWKRKQRQKQQNPQKTRQKQMLLKPKIRFNQTVLWQSAQIETIRFVQNADELLELKSFLADSTSISKKFVEYWYSQNRAFSVYQIQIQSRKLEIKFSGRQNNGKLIFKEHLQSVPQWF